MKRSRLKRFSHQWYNKFADAFYDQDYPTLSRLAGKRISNQVQAESALAELSKKRVMVRGKLL